MMGKELILYEKNEFFEILEEKKKAYIDIYSITKYINNVDLIESHSLCDIVDISSLNEFSNTQSLSEQIIYRFSDGVLFMCEVSKWESMSFDLRCLFDISDIENFKDKEEISQEDVVNNDLETHLRTLFYYDKEDFYSYQKHQEEKGISIVSISKFISDIKLIKNFNPQVEVIDISSISEYSKCQSIAEEVIWLFEPKAIFICDQSKRELIEYTLRLVFKEFKNIDVSNFIGTAIITGEEGYNRSTDKHLKITDLTDIDLDNFLIEFNERLYGHPKFKDDFANHLKTFRVFNRLGEHKILSIFLMGDSGVGKTEVARLIFECMKGTRKLAKINFGNYSNEFSLSSLIGSARGYIGSDDGEIFMKVRDTDVGVLLIDEFEKSNATLFNYFLDVLESGKMTNSLGQEIDLNGFIIVFTSNISKEDYKKRISPELRSRFDYKCMFTVLSNDDKLKYLWFRANSIVKKLSPDADSAFVETLSDYLQSKIDVSKYHNMRDINKQIKKVFVDYLSNNKLQTEV